MSSAAADSAVGSSSYGEAVAPTTTSAIIAESVSGSHVLQIKGYSLTKGLGSSKYIKSSTFSVCGHRWYVRYYPDGDALDTADWISMYLQHDPITADAAWNVKARLKFSVLDGVGELVPSMSKDSTSHTFSSKSPCWGFKKFVKRMALENSTYLKHDCLKVRCDITVSKGVRTEATMELVVVPPSNMHRHFGRLLLGAEGMDVKFEVAGEMFTAHRCVLAARSSVFMAELFGPMKEKAMDCIIRIQDMEARVFRAMLHFIYTDTMPDIDKEDAFVFTQHLLVAEDRYDLERLKLICEDRLCNCIDTGNVAMTLALADWHGCHVLKNVCFEFLKSAGHLKAVTATEGFDQLMATCPSLIKELLTKMATSP